MVRSRVRSRDVRMAHEAELIEQQYWDCHNNEDVHKFVWSLHPHERGALFTGIKEAQTQRQPQQPDFQDRMHKSFA